MVHGYRVHPAGVNAVVRAVVTSSGPIAQAASDLGGDVQLVAESAQSAIIASAMEDAFGVIGTRLQSVQTRIPAVLRGTANAGRAVQDGDDAMAGQIIAAATGSLAMTDAVRGFAGRRTR